MQNITNSVFSNKKCDQNTQIPPLYVLHILHEPILLAESKPIDHGNYLYLVL